MQEIFFDSHLKLVKEEGSRSLECHEWKEIRQERLINSLNRINFKDEKIVINFRHLKHSTLVSFFAKPSPCLKDCLECQWVEPIEPDQRLQECNFENLSYSDGSKQVYVDAKLISLDGNGAKFSLPESALEINARKVRRHKAENISAKIIHGKLILKGELISFSAVSFSVYVKKDSLGIYREFNKEDRIQVILKKGASKLYSGKCKVYRISNDHNGKLIVMMPTKDCIQRFKPKKQRSIRQEFLPSPSIIFTHPLTGNRNNLKALDISGSGFSVREDINDTSLIPGLVIPDLRIELMNGIELKCKAQVVYRAIEDDDIIKYGVAYLDMQLKDQIKLSSMLHMVKNKYAYLCPTNIDLDALWDFFFETGFIYPEKYSFIQEQKKKFFKLYQDLYCHSPEISRHVIYQARGKIYGHVSMLRFYKKTWMMHHHAAIRSPKHKAGLIVMEHILQYINETHNIPSNKMNYICCYFRPNNRFADRVFGGAAKSLKDPKKCSLDSFAYLHKNISGDKDLLPENWKLTVTTENELENFRHHYDEIYGGLLIEGLDLNQPPEKNDRSINKVYNKLGFSRDRYFYTLKDSENLKAILVVNCSEAGLNMSDLTNCIQFFVLDTEKITEKILFSAIISLSSHYEQNDIPILIFPSSFAEEKNIKYEKTYKLTVLDLEYMSPYLEFMESLTNLAARKRK